MSHHEHADQRQAATDYFEPEGWEQRYAGDAQTWSGRANPRLVELASTLTPGTALDVGCGEGGDVVWLAQQGWHATGADFSRNGLARAARHAEQAGVADRVDWWQVDARRFDAQGRTFDLVTSHYLHPPDGGMVEVTRRLATAVAPGGHLLVVGHALHSMPGAHDGHDDQRTRAMFAVEDLLPALPADMEVLIAEERPRRLVREGRAVDVADVTLAARRRT